MMPLIEKLLEAYSRFACRGYPDAALLLHAAAVLTQTGDLAFARAALATFDRERSFFDADAELLNAIQHELDTLVSDDELDDAALVHEEQVGPHHYVQVWQARELVWWEVRDSSETLIVSCQPAAISVEQATREGVVAGAAVALRAKRAAA